MGANGLVGGALVALLTTVMTSTVGWAPAEASADSAVNVANEDMWLSDDEAPPGTGDWFSLVYDQYGLGSTARVVVDDREPVHHDGSLQLSTPGRDDRVSVTRLLTTSSAIGQGLSDFQSGSYRFRVVKGEKPAAYTVGLQCGDDGGSYTSGDVDLTFAGPFPQGTGWTWVDVVQDRQTLWWSDRAIRADGTVEPGFVEDPGPGGLRPGPANPYTLEAFTAKCGSGPVRNHGLALATPGAVSRVDAVTFNGQSTNFWIPPLVRVPDRASPGGTYWPADRQFDRPGFHSDDSWPDPLRPRTVPRAVVIADPNSVREVLVAGPLANAVRGPLLLPSGRRAEWSRDLPSSVSGYLGGRGRVFLVGGTDAIGVDVAASLRDRGYTVVRLVGRDGYETSVKVARTISRFRPAGTRERLVLATGRGLPDAMTASAAAGAGKGALLLTRGETLPGPVAGYLSKHPGAATFAVGLDAVRATRHLPRVTGVLGRNRSTTAVRVANLFFPTPRSVALTSPVRATHPLLAGAYAGQARSPLLLVNRESVPRPVRRYLVEHRQTLRDNVLIADEPTVVTATFDTLLGVLRPR